MISRKKSSHNRIAASYNNIMSIHTCIYIIFRVKILRNTMQTFSGHPIRPSVLIGIICSHSSCLVAVRVRLMKKRPKLHRTVLGVNFTLAGWEQAMIPSKLVIVVRLTLIAYLTGVVIIFIVVANKYVVVRCVQSAVTVWVTSALDLSRHS